MLCGACQDLFRGSKENSSRGGAIHHHLSASDFFKAVASDCQICVNLWNCLSGNLGVDPWSLTSSDYANDFLTRRINEPVESDYMDRQELWFFLGSKCFAAFILQPLRELEHRDTTPIVEAVSSNTNSDSAWATVSQWVQECFGSHASCVSIPSHQPWYPTRLIDVGPDSSSKIRLCITQKEIPASPDYITLSHCWGLSQIPRLLDSNMSEMVEDIPFELLPLTFQESIKVTRRLGVRYLWIDSLCIIQDSTQDWQREASMMSQVYSHCKCNIAATRSVDASYGLFAKRLPGLVAPIIVESDWAGHDNEVYVILGRDFWKSHVDWASLNQRAWVLQERFMAPRVLHFGQHRLLWECREKSMCETFPRGLPINGIPVDDAQLRRNCLSNHNWKRTVSHELQNPLLNIYDVFNSLIEAYSQCQLTKEEDKLIAFSGVAKQTQQQVDDEYLAGLWRQRLPEDLCWYVKYQRQGNGRPSSRPSQWRAPSWSWASVDGSIGYYDKHTESSQENLVTVLECSVTALGPDRIAQVTDACLVLQGTLYRTTLMIDSAATDLGGRRVSVAGHELKAAADLDVALDAERVDVFFLPMVCVNHVWGEYGWGLLLDFAHSSEQTRYTRIGALDVPDAADWFLLEKVFAKALVGKKTGSRASNEEFITII